MKTLRYAAMALSPLIISTTLQATTLLYKNFNDVIDEAQFVVSGTIKKLKVKETKEGDYYTTVVLKDASFIDADGEHDAYKNIKIRYKGGAIDIIENGKVIGSKGMYAEGTPQLNKGEQVILFISNNGISDMPFHGWGQGIFKIDDNLNMKDSQQQSIVSINGGNLVVKKSDGNIQEKGRLIQPATSQEGTFIIDSEGGEDRKIESITNEMATSYQYSSLDRSTFISIIKEKKHQNSYKKMNALTTRNHDVFYSLPPIKQVTKSPKTLMTTNELSILNKTNNTQVQPVLPKKKPSVQNNSLSKETK